MGIFASVERGYMRLHEAIYVRTDGRVGRMMVGVPTLLLHTTGRRSGLPRTVALVYAQDGDRYAVVASNHGWEKPPAWLVNLQSEPKVRIQVGRTHADGIASTITPDDAEYPRLWQLLNRVNHNRYDAYQSKTSRPIPLVVIRPA
jgi:deazaflavin-dependent oxidoreductase (nitroreductase family)